MCPTMHIGRCIVLKAGGVVVCCKNRRKYFRLSTLLTNETKYKFLHFHIFCIVEIQMLSNNSIFYEFYVEKRHTLV